jgi:dATP pyrophosphohydrolase
LPDYKIPISTLVVIYTIDLEVLLIERADHPGYWQSVTGSQHTGETLAETAAREVMEETGLNVAEYEFSDWQLSQEYEIYPEWRYRYAPGTTRNMEHVFGLRVPKPVEVILAPREHIAYRWLPWQEAAQKVFSPTNRRVILEIPKRNHIV